MKELLQGRRIGFALRPLFGQVAIGLGLATTLLDLMAWFAWGTRITNGYAVAAQWMAIATAFFCLLAVLMSIAEWVDAALDDRGLARLDLVASGIAFALYAASAAWRLTEPGAAAASPGPFLLAIGALALLIADGVIGANLYAGREWEELLEEEPVRHRRRRAARG